MCSVPKAHTWCAMLKINFLMLFCGWLRTRLIVSFNITLWLQTSLAKKISFTLFEFINSEFSAEIELIWIFFQDGSYLELISMWKALLTSYTKGRFDQQKNGQKGTHIMSSFSVQICERIIFLP